jgi:predicted anti-sigma-YlaC factor YlaD
MICEGLSELLIGYVDRQLSDEEIGIVEQELANCECCRKFVKLEHNTKRLVKLCVPKEELPEGLMPNILAMIESECERQRLESEPQN